MKLQSSCWLVLLSINSKTRKKDSCAFMTGCIWCCLWFQNQCMCCLCHGPLTRYVNCVLRMRRDCWERFPRHQLQWKTQVSDPGMHHGTCVTHVPWCMPGSLFCGGRGKRSRHSRRMRNPQFYISGKRPIAIMLTTSCYIGLWYNSKSSPMNWWSILCSQYFSLSPIFVAYNAITFLWARCF